MPITKTRVIPILVFCLFISFSLIPSVLTQQTTLNPQPLSTGLWDYRKPIVIQASQVQADHAGFPVLISIVDTDLRDNAQSDGDDILFTNADNTAKLNHEIEHYNSTTGELEAWVRIPFLSSTADTTIYMYYGRSDCPSQQNPAGVWDTNYVLVQHLEEKTGTVYDSTANHNDGTPEGEITQNATGKIDGAYFLDGYDDCASVPESASLNPASAITVETWVNFSDASSNCRVVSKGRPWIDGGYHINNENGQLRFAIRTSGEQTVTASESISLNQWTYVVGTYDGSSLKIYVNGALSNTFESPTGDLMSSTGDLFLGCENRDRYFNGALDEVRISDTARDANWIKTSYNNMNNPGTFIQVGATQSSPAQPIPEFPSPIILLASAMLTLIAVAVCQRRNANRPRGTRKPL